MLLPEPIEKPKDGMSFDEGFIEQVFDHERLADYNQAFLDLHEFTESQVDEITPLLLSGGSRTDGLSKWRTLIHEGVLEVSTRERSSAGAEKFIKGEYQLLFDEQERIIGHFGIEQEVTDFHQAFESLHSQKNEAVHREKRILSAFSSSDIGYWDWELKTNTVQFNSEWFQMLGYDHQEKTVVSSRWLQIIHPDDYKKAKAIALDIEKGVQGTLEIEIRIKHRKGHWEYLAVLGRIIENNPDNSPARLVGTYANTTRFKLAELEMAKRIERLGKSFDAGGLSLWELDFANKRGYATNQWGDYLDNIFDDSYNDFSFQEWFSKVHSDDLQLILDQLKDLEEGKSDTLYFAYRIRNEDGRYIWIQDRGKVIEYDEQNKPLKLIGVTNDLSDVRKTEDRFQIALDGAHQGMWEWNIVTNEVVFHEGWLQMYGLTADDIPNNNYEFWKNMVHVDDYPYVHEELTRHVSGETPFFRTEYRIRHKKGHYIWVLDHGKVVESRSDGKPIYAMGTCINIDKQKRHQIDLENLVQMREKFLDILSHDLKTPIANISGLVELLESAIDFNDNQDASLYFDMLRKSSGHLNEMIQNLLIWSRAKGGRIPYEPSYFKLVELIHKAVKPYIEIGRTKGVSVLIDEHTDKDMHLFIDMNMMITVFANILTNAIKFTQPGGTVLVTVRQDLENVLISISDNGIGMAQKKIESLFTPGKNISTPGTEGEKGTGLGMLIVHDFMQYHHGKVKVESEVGKGSNFTLSFPRRTRN
jgi:PAS domain S-box-containing protein